MKKSNAIFGLILSAGFVLFASSVSKNISANAGYLIAAHFSDHGAVQNFGAGAGGAAGWLGATWAGAKIGGQLGSVVGGPVGIILGAGLGAA